jgi:flavin reductase (DIM6/NTAB) family NADH-FMN oxidoreductase RutF/DNA-binding MarR family transcriptional regulator
MSQTVETSDFSQHAFRRALGNFATGVTIITAVSPEGEKVGVTASSFNSLSMDPPLVLWSSMKTARSCAIFESASHFAVNILTSDQMQLSNHFARQNEDKFAGIDWEPGIGGAPILPDCAGRFQCEAYDKLDGGDHWIFVGKVVAFDDFGRPPLCFHQGSYSMVFNHPGNGSKRDVALTSHSEGRTGNHNFFLMLKAIRAYQDRYQPKLEGLGLSLIEARALMVLGDASGGQAHELVADLNAPITEVREALLNLRERGLIEASGEGFAVSSAGQVKVDQCWNLADTHAEQTFDEFSQDEMATFTHVLRILIEQS